MHGFTVSTDSIYAGHLELCASLIGKLIVHGRDRDEALARLSRSLGELIVDGIDTTVPLFHALLQEKAAEDARGWGGFFAIFRFYNWGLAFPLSGIVFSRCRGAKPAKLQGGMTPIPGVAIFTTAPNGTEVLGAGEEGELCCTGL